MIWKTGTKRTRQLQWHKWFAWFPVVVNNESGVKTKVWLEYVERKKVHIQGDWFETGYRELLIRKIERIQEENVSSKI